MCKDIDKKIPQALREVWEWKDRLYEDTKHMSLKEYADYLRRKHEGTCHQDTHGGDLL